MIQLYMTWTELRSEIVLLYQRLIINNRENRERAVCMQHILGLERKMNCILISNLEENKMLTVG